MAKQTYLINYDDYTNATPEELAEQFPQFASTYVDNGKEEVAVLFPIDRIEGYPTPKPFYQTFLERMEN